MAAPFTSAAKNKLLDHVTGRVRWEPNLRVALGIDDAGTVTEISGNGYARANPTGAFGAASGGAASITELDVLWPVADPASWGIPDRVAYFDTDGTQVTAWEPVTIEEVAAGVRARIPAAGIAGAFASITLTDPA